MKKYGAGPQPLSAVAFLPSYAFTTKANLQALLQLFYVVMALYGWYEWMYGKREQQQLHIVSFPLNKILLLIAIGIPFTVAGALIDQHFDASMPWLDSVITVYSLIATWMMAKKITQNWLFWMVIDPLSIWLFAARGRLLIGLLFLIYTAIAIFGYFKWRKMMQQQAMSA